MYNLLLLQFNLVFVAFLNFVSSVFFCFNVPLHKELSLLFSLLL